MNKFAMQTPFPAIEFVSSS